MVAVSGKTDAHTDNLSKLSQLILLGELVYVLDKLVHVVFP